ncbi:MAG: type II secretion system protein GspN [Candidatus Lernaella stagnicola]|nr:type II secretion system protein GspN [Candidatus Lernaella stagnicola]
MRKHFAWLAALKSKTFWGFAGLFIALFMIFLYLTFPFDAITSYAVQKIESQGNFRVEIEEMSPFRLTGVSIKGLQVRDAEDRRKVFLTMDEIRVRLRPTQLLLGRLWVDFDIYAYDGGVAGSYCFHRGIHDVAMDFVDLNLSKYGTKEVARKFGSFDLAGVIGGAVAASLHPKQRRNNSGTVSLNFDRLRVMNIDLVGKKFPDLTFEPSRASLTLKNQTLQVNEFNLKGNHIELLLDGSLRINQSQPTSSRANLTVKFKPSEEFEDALGVVAMALGEPNEEGFYTKRVNQRLALKGTE